MSDENTQVDGTEEVEEAKDDVATPDAEEGAEEATEEKTEEAA